MTLLEVIVALSIAGMAIGIAVATFQTVLRVHDDNSRFAAEMVRCASLRSSLAAWIEGALPMSGDVDRFRGIARDGPDGAADELTLVTSAATPLGQGEVEIHLTLASREAHRVGGLVIHFREPSRGQEQDVMLDSTVRSMRIAYLPARDSTSRWIPGWISSVTLPRAVRVTLETTRFDDSGALLSLPIIIPLERSR